MIPFILALLLTGATATANDKINCDDFFELNPPTKNSKPASSFEKEVDRHQLSRGDINDIGKYLYNSKSYQLYVKFLIEVDSNGNLGRIFFQDTNKYGFHFEYIRARFLPNVSTSEVDQITLRRQGRRFLLGTLLMVKPDYTENTFEPGSNSAEFYRLDLITEDPFTVDEAIKAVQKIKSALDGFGNPELIVPRSQADEYRRSQLDFAAANVGLYFPELAASPREVYASGWGVGQLRYLNPQQFNEAFKAGAIKATDILLLDETPRELPPVAGVIVAEPSTPSSHVALLSQMYGIPFWYELDAVKKYSSKAGQTLYVAAREQSGVVWTNVDPIGPNEAQTILRLKKKTPLGAPPIDRTITKISKLNLLREADTAAYGAKAVGLGLLMRELPENTAAHGVGLPISFYDQFLKTAKIKNTPLEQFIAEKKSSLQANNLAEVLVALREIREAILAAEIPAVLLTEIRDAINQEFGTSAVKLKFRSSSNVEDLKGFNGAGLYDSKGGRSDNIEAIALALKTVWSSVYNDRAFLARREFGVDERAVGMGVLIQKSFKGELANGVAVFGSENSSFVSTITGFPGEDLEVTAAPPGVIPESMEMTQTGESFSAQLLQESTEVPVGRQLLNENEYIEMAKLMRQVFERHPERNQNLRLDFEWKVMPDANGARRIFFKQVRPMPNPQGVDVNQVVLLSSGLDLKRYEPENENGLQVYFTPESIDLKWKAVSVEAVLKGQSFLSDLVFKHREGDIPLVIKTVTPTLTEGANGGNSISKTLKLMVVAQHPFLGVVELSFELDLTTDAAGKVVFPVKNIAASRFLLSINKSVVPAQGDNSWGDHYWVYYGRPGDLTNTYKDMVWSASAKDGSLAIQIQTKEINSGHFQKTAFQDVEQATLRDAELGEFVVNRQGLLYAPAHHNFSYSYVIDLNHMAETGPRAGKLRAKYGRYLLVSGNLDSEIRFSGYSVEISPDGAHVFHLVKAFEGTLPN